MVGTNVLGSLLGSQAALRLMLRQPVAAGPNGAGPSYHIFNMGNQPLGSQGGLAWGRWTE